MLSFMRKKAGSWIIKVIFGIIVIVFVFFYGFSGVRKKTGSNSVLASVGDKKITRSQYSVAYKNMLNYYRSVYKNQLADEVLANLGLKQKVLENLIDMEVLLQEAKRIGIRIQPDDVKKSILSDSQFQQNGVFSQALYKRVLSFYEISAVDYEQEREKEMMIQALEAMVKNTAKVSEKELKEFYSLQNEMVNIEYVSLDPEMVKEKPDVPDAEIDEYYKTNKENFRVGEQVKVNYIVFDPKEYEDDVEVPAKEIEDYYELDKDRFFEQKTVKAKHILFKVEAAASEEQMEQVRKNAQGILEKIKNGESFTKLAEKYSQDSATAVKGGDMGYFKKGDMVKEFEETAFSLQPGETSSLVKTEYGFHIITVDDVKEAGTKSFNDVKDDIEKDIRKEKAQELVRTLAKRALNRLFKSRNIEEYAKKNGIKLSETAYFTFGGALEDAESNDLFSKESFALSPGEMAPAFAIGQKYFLVKLLDRQESSIPPIEDVKIRIVKELEEKKKIELTMEKAQKILSQLMNGKEKWENVGKKYDLSIKEAELKRSSDYIKDIGQAKQLKDAAFKLEQASPFAPMPFQTAKGIFIVQLKEKVIPDESDFQKNREQTSEVIMRNKREAALTQFLKALKTKAIISVNTELFSSV